MKGPIEREFGLYWVGEQSPGELGDVERTVGDVRERLASDAEATVRLTAGSSSFRDAVWERLTRAEQNRVMIVAPERASGTTPRRLAPLEAVDQRFCALCSRRTTGAERCGRCGQLRPELAGETFPPVADPEQRARALEEFVRRARGGEPEWLPWPARKLWREARSRLNHRLEQRKGSRCAGDIGHRSEFWRELSWRFGDEHAHRLCWWVDLYARAFRLSSEAFHRRLPR